MGTPSFEALRRRYEQHETAQSAGNSGRGEAALATALAAIGWWAAGADAVEEVASLGWQILKACVRGHRDPALAARDLADLMRRYAPPHSDFLASVEDFLPAAADVLRRYAAGEEQGGLLPPAI